MKIRTPEKIVGLDLSLTSTGVVYCFPEAGTIQSAIIKTSPKQNYMERYNQILDEVRVACRSKDVIFFIEGYSLGSFAKSTAMSNLIELGGIIRFYLWEQGIPFIIVPPTLLKKFVTGKGNAKKEDIKLGIYKRYAKEFKTSDEADAYGLVAMGYAYFTGKLLNGKELTLPEQECMKRIRGESHDS